MGKEDFGRNGGEDPLEVPHGLCPGNLHAGGRVLEQEGAEPIVCDQVLVQVRQQGGAELPDEGSPDLVCKLLVLDPCALDEDRQVRVLCLYQLAQLYPCQGVFLPLFCICHVRDDSQDVVAVALVQGDGIFEGACKEYLGTSAHAKRLAPAVEGLQHARSVLSDEACVHQRQI